ncbi:MAG: carboxymuconolactone decarboxylase family protein, partial [Maricaulaceae bacterium]
MTTRYPNLPNRASLPDLFEFHPEARSELFALLRAVMRGPGPFEPGERELIAAFVSGVNSCSFCVDAHGMVAEAFGLPRQLIDDLVNRLENAEISDRMRPLLSYCGKLTRAPSSINDADAAAVYDAGWSEDDLHQAVLITGLFNIMNRLSEGAGLTMGRDLALAAPEQAEAV